MAAGALAVVLHAAASLRGFFPLCLFLPLQGSVTFLALVPHLEAWSELLTLFIPCSFLVVALSAPAVGFAVALWLWLECALSRFLCVGLVDRSCTVSLLTVSVIGARFTYAVGRLPMRLVPYGPLGSCGGSTYVALHRPGWSTPVCRVTLELRSVFPIFLCVIPHVSMAIILSVSLTPACPCLIFTLGAVPWTLA